MTKAGILTTVFDVVNCSNIPKCWSNGPNTGKRWKMSRQSLAFVHPWIQIQMLEINVFDNRTTTVGQNTSHEHKFDKQAPTTTQVKPYGWNFDVCPSFRFTRTPASLRSRRIALRTSSPCWTFRYFFFLLSHFVTWPVVQAQRCVALTLYKKAVVCERELQTKIFVWVPIKWAQTYNWKFCKVWSAFSFPFLTRNVSFVEAHL